IEFPSLAPWPSLIGSPLHPLELPEFPVIRGQHPDITGQPSPRSWLHQVNDRSIAVQGVHSPQGRRPPVEIPGMYIEDPQSAAPRGYIHPGKTGGWFIIPERRRLRLEKVQPLSDRTG